VANAPLSRWTCTNCARSFSTNQALKYHTTKQVCGRNDHVDQASPSDQLQQEAAVDRPRLTRQKTEHVTVIAALEPETQGSQRPTQNSVVKRTPKSLPQATSHRPASDVPSERVTSINPENAAQLDSSQTTPSEQRKHPSELPREKLAELNKVLAKAELEYRGAVLDVPDSLPAEERALKLRSLKNSFASRQSGIRRKFGVTLKPAPKDKSSAAASVLSKRKSAGTSVGDPPKRHKPSTSDEESDPLNGSGMRQIGAGNGYQIKRHKKVPIAGLQRQWEQFQPRIGPSGTNTEGNEPADMEMLDAPQSGDLNGSNVRAQARGGIVDSSGSVVDSSSDDDIPARPVVRPLALSHRGGGAFRGMTGGGVTSQSPARDSNIPGSSRGRGMARRGDARSSSDDRRRAS